MHCANCFKTLKKRIPVMPGSYDFSKVAIPKIYCAKCFSKLNAWLGKVDRRLRQLMYGREL